MDTVDQLELNLKNLEDELKAAEQQYLQKINDIVLKYTNKAKQFRTKSLTKYENNVNTNNKIEPSIPKEQSSKESTRDILMNSPLKSSGTTPLHVQKIRESLQRGKHLYEINRNKENIQIDNSAKMQNEADIQDNDDDLNIIPLNKWSRKLPNISQSINTINSSLSMSKLNQSHDYNREIMEMHKENSISDSSSICSFKFKMTANSKLKKQLMVNRLRRKRKYDHISEETNDKNIQTFEPPKKKTHIKSIDVMSSRDLKNELRRIRAKNTTHSLLNRKKLLLTKSISNFSKKYIFNRDSTSESDDDLRTTKP